LAVLGGNGQNFKKLTKLDRQYHNDSYLASPSFIHSTLRTFERKKSIAAFAVLYLIIAMGIIIFKHAE
jgi:hypothetical protein